MAIVEQGFTGLDAGDIQERFVDLKERNSTMDMTPNQAFQYSNFDVDCP